MTFLLLEIGTVLLLGALLVAAPEPPLPTINSIQDEYYEVLDRNTPLHRSYISSFYLEAS